MSPRSGATDTGSSFRHPFRGFPLFWLLYPGFRCASLRFTRGYPYFAPVRGLGALASGAESMETFEPNSPSCRREFLCADSRQTLRLSSWNCWTTKPLFPRRGCTNQPRVAATPLPWDSDQEQFLSLKGINNQVCVCSSLSGTRGRMARFPGVAGEPHYPGLEFDSPSGNGNLQSVLRAASSFRPRLHTDLRFHKIEKTLVSPSQPG
jgi:hypothetical protein